MEVDLVAVALTLLFKLGARAIDVGPGEGLRVCEQNVIIGLELRCQREFESHAKALPRALPAAVCRDSLPILRVYGHLPALKFQEIRVRQDQEDRLVAVAEQLSLLALVLDSDAQGASRFDRTLRRQPAHSKVELCAGLFALDVRHGVRAEPHVITEQFVFGR